MIGVGTNTSWSGKGDMSGLPKLKKPTLSDSNAAIEKTKGHIDKFLTNQFGYVNSGQYIKQLTEVAIALIIERTISGRDYAEKSFQRYSKRYLKEKIALGKYRGRVDLWLTGDLLNSMEGTTKTKLTSSIGFPSSIHRGSGLPMWKLAAIHNSGLGNMPQRKFMDWRLAGATHLKFMRVATGLLTEAMRKTIATDQSTPRFKSNRIPNRKILS